VVPDRLNAEMKEIYLNKLFNHNVDDDATFRETLDLNEELSLCNSMRGKEMNENPKILDRYYYITKNDPRENFEEDT
jgi:hypothetical protein